jgi:hypothetical protein
MKSTTRNKYFLAGEIQTISYELLQARFRLEKNKKGKLVETRERIQNVIEELDSIMESLLS